MKYRSENNIISAKFYMHIFSQDKYHVDIGYLNF